MAPKRPSPLPLEYPPAGVESSDEELTMSSPPPAQKPKQDKTPSSSSFAPPRTTTVEANSPKPDQSSSDEEESDLDSEADDPMEDELLESMLLRQVVGSPGLDEGFMRQGIGMIDNAKKRDLEEKWRNLFLAETRVSMRRNDLIVEQMMLLLDAYQKQESSPV